MSAPRSLAAEEHVQVVEHRGRASEPRFVRRVCERDGVDPTAGGAGVDGAGVLVEPEMGLLFHEVMRARDEPFGREIGF